MSASGTVNERPLAAIDARDVHSRAGGRGVLGIAHDFPPSLDIGAHACAQVLNYLPRYGWQPTVLTVHERYIERRDDGTRVTFPGRIIRTRVLPHPLFLYQFVKTYRFRKTGDGRGSRGPQGHGPSAAGWATPLRQRLLSLLTVPDVATGWILPAFFSGLATINRHGLSRIFSSGPAWTNHLIALLLARVSGLPWVAHFRDPWVTGHSSMFASRLAQRLEQFLEARVIRAASTIICVTEEHTALLRSTYPHVPPHKFVTIPNGYDNAEWPEVSANEPASEKFIVLYAGTLYGSRNPEPVLRALGDLVRRGTIDPVDLAVKFVGWDNAVGGRRLTDIAASAGLVAHVALTGPVDRPRALAHMRQASLLLLLAEDMNPKASGRTVLQIPGKTYEYLRAGRPILAITSPGAVANLLHRTGGAWIVEPGDEPALAGALSECYLAWKRGQSAPRPDAGVVAAFDRHLLARRFAEVLEGAGD